MADGAIEAVARYRYNQTRMLFGEILSLAGLRAPGVSRRWRLATAAFLAFPLAAAGASDLDQQFTQTVRPFVTQYCIACHSGKSPAAQFDLKSYTTLEW